MKASSTRYTTCEKDFVLKSIKKGIRLDGRQAFDYRNIDIKFALDYGCCEVQLGDTKVLAQTSAEIVKPRETRPTEGELFLNIDLSPLASTAYESGRMSEYGMEVNRLVERCLKESRPIDVESLCIIAGEKVWNVRVDVLLLNDSGNILDCCCIAAIASLSHFQRPEVTVADDGCSITIHSMEEKESIPLNVHHVPICTTFGFIENGEQIIVDPEEKEEVVVEGKLIMAFNIHGEVCCAQMSGGVSLEYEHIMQCAKIASIKAIEINDLIKEGLEVDRIRRAPVPLARREGLKTPAVPRVINNTRVEATEVDTDIETPTAVKEAIAEAISSTGNESLVEGLGKGIASIGNGTDSWVMDEDSDDDDEVCGYTPTPMAPKNTDVEEYDPLNENGNAEEEEEEEEDVGYKPSAIINNNNNNTSTYAPSLFSKTYKLDDNDVDDGEEEDEAYTPMEVNAAVVSEEVEEYDPETGGYDPTESMSDTSALELCYKPTPIPKTSTTPGYIPSVIKKTNDVLCTTNVVNVEDTESIAVGNKSDSEEEELSVLEGNDLDRGKDTNHDDGDDVNNVNEPPKSAEETYKDNVENLNSCRAQEKSTKKKGRKKKKGKKSIT